jgi:Zn-dependent peptidase ImmA (M78 family)/transcriptional regulator with XRE-family HTH domain
VDKALLDAIFGLGSSGATPEERARTSSKEFVRSQLQLAEKTERATGRTLSAAEALLAYGIDMLCDVMEKGSALLISGRDEPARTIRLRREALGLDITALAKASDLQESVIRRLETEGVLSPSHELDRVARALAIDERYVGMTHPAKLDCALGVRFKALGAEAAGKLKIKPTLALSLLDAAWVIRRQTDLDRALGNTFPCRDKFRPNANYDFPTYERGYELAKMTRSILDLQPDEPINSVRQLIEKRLGIPLIEIPLGTRIAGATIANGESRGIVANTKGNNENPWVRRMTMAHELAHLLWDPDQKLERLLIDRYEEMESSRTNHDSRDAVEVRANAFAVAFLAPKPAVQRIARKHNHRWSGVVELCETYGISRTAGLYHMQNVCGCRIDPEGVEPEVSDEWRAAEDRGNVFFPIKETRQSRVGHFAWLVMQANREKLISQDTAAQYLDCQTSEIAANIDVVLDVSS